MTTTPLRSVIIGNTHALVADEKKVGNKHQWGIYVLENEPSHIPSANDVKLSKVVYNLHPSFNPNKISRTAEKAAADGAHPFFTLTRTGWGSFVITVELHWTDGQIDNASHELQFEKDDERFLHRFAILNPATAAAPAQPPAGSASTSPHPHHAAKDLHDGDGMGEAQMSEETPPEEPVASPSSSSHAPIVDDSTPAMSEAEAAIWHGYLLRSAGLAKPVCVTESKDLSRPDYTKIKSAEFCDTPETLDAKADMLIQMWTKAEHPLIYAGAGISTSSGIWDYASNAKGSKVQPTKRALTMNFINSLKPTPAHRVITAMEKKGHVWGWLQQNHDGLAQKAGFPGDKVNELHGSWLNQKENPIIKMSGSLRGDLFDWCLDMEKKCDFVFAIGTSLSGLNSDRVAGTVAERHMNPKKPQGQGLAIISIQQTPYDDVAGLRIYSRIDDFMMLVAKKMKLVLDKKDHIYRAPRLPVGPPKESDWQAERAKKQAAAK